ncbi:MAG: hypothetical protein QXP98_00470 [Thermoproteus sp.]
MTLIFATVYGRGVVVFADSRAAGPDVAYEERKIYPVYLVKEGEEVDLAVAAGAGDAALVKQGFERIESAFKGFYEKEGRCPTDAEVQKIVNRLQRDFVNFYSYLRARGIGTDVLHILATVSLEGKPYLYLIRPDGVFEPRHSSPGYAVIGIAEQSAQVLLKMLGWTPEAEWGAEMLAAFVIDTIAEVVPTVSPLASFQDTMYIWHDGRKVVMGPLREDVFKTVKGKAARRRALIKMMWDLLERGVEEDEVEDVLKSLMQRRLAARPET